MGPEGALLVQFSQLCRIRDFGPTDIGVIHQQRTSDFPLAVRWDAHLSTDVLLWGNESQPHERQILVRRENDPCLSA